MKSVIRCDGQAALGGGVGLATNVSMLASATHTILSQGFTQRAHGSQYHQSPTHRYKRHIFSPDANVRRSTQHLFERKRKTRSQPQNSPLVRTCPALQRPPRTAVLVACGLASPSVACREEEDEEEEEVYCQYYSQGLCLHTEPIPCSL